jgi:uncharacterized protein (TIGR02001 family)
MKKYAFPLMLAAGLAGWAASSASAADMAVKAAPAPAAAPVSPWDVAITAAVMTDYNWRGITQSDHQPSVQGGFEPRYNVTKDVQLYAGISGESIDFPNHAAAEIDLYGGIRPTFDKLALDFGFWYYDYPGGQCYHDAMAGCLPGVSAFDNYAKADASFYEVYGKATYTVNDNLSVGAQVWYSPSVSNTGADGLYYAGNVTLTAPANMLPNGIGAYASADLAYWSLGTTDAFYGNTPLPSYTSWDLGLGFTWKVFTLDLRYYDTDLSKYECNTITGDFTATAAGDSNWCSATFIAKLSAAVNLSGLK